MEKKISFGFSKVVKKPQIISTPIKEEVEKIELIDCLEGQSIKIAGKVEDAPEALLVIPLAANTTPLEKVKQLREENAPANPKNELATANGSNHEETLEERAAREIMTDLKAKEEEEEQADKFTVALKSDEIKLGGAKESTMDDYEDVPIVHFGLAMLRGMGWKDEEHKQQKKKMGLEDDIIVCRPKGLGLGADKAMKQQVNAATNSANPNEKLVMKKGAHARIMGGKHKDFYGQVEGMDEESGRVFIKLALGGARESINEAFVQLVTEQEFKENRKVLNVARYEEYKNKEGNGDSNSRRKEESRERKKESREGYVEKNKHTTREDKSSSHRRREDRDKRSRSRSAERRKESHSSKHSHHRSSRDDEGNRSSHRDRYRDRSGSRDRDRKHKDDDYRRREKKDGAYKESSSNSKRRDR